MYVWGRFLITFVGLNAASESARAFFNPGEVVHDLLKPGTGNNLSCRPPPAVDSAVIFADSEASSTTSKGGFTINCVSVLLVVRRTGKVVATTIKNAREKITTLEVKMAIYKSIEGVIVG